MFRLSSSSKPHQTQNRGRRKTAKYNIFCLEDLFFYSKDAFCSSPTCCFIPCSLTCWSTATASRPSYMMLTQPSLQDRTKRDISACTTETNTKRRCQSECKSRCQKAGCVGVVANLSQVVKVVFPSNPAITRLQAFCFIGDVSDVWSFTVEEFPFEQLQRDRCNC